MEVVMILKIEATIVRIIEDKYCKRHCSFCERLHHNLYVINTKMGVIQLCDSCYENSK